MIPAPGRSRGGLADAFAGASMGCVYAAWLLRTTKDLGYARDEGFYFQASTAYGRWFELLLSNASAALQRRAVDQAWAANHEHPALIKSLFALSFTFLQKKLHLFSMDGTSFRFPAIVLAGALIALVYVWGAEARGRLAGLAAAVFLGAMPRVFYQAHLACFDVPIVFFWTATAYAYWRTMKGGGAAWPVATGVLFGLALDTKHNAWFLPFALATHAAIAFGLARFEKDAPLAELRGRRAASALGAMAALGPLVFVALWPWLWHDTLARFRGYASFHLNHEYYNMEFFGETYWKPPMPRLYAPVMTLATVPFVTIALFFAGLGERGRALVVRRLPLDVPATELLWLGGLLVNYVAWLSPSTPIFGGTKHWMTAYPFLALFAGSGLASAVAAARRVLGRRARSWAVPAAALSIAAFAAPVVETAHAHPWGLSAYTPIVGGAQGAATLGLNRTFWGYTTGAVVDYLNRAAPPNATVYIHDTAGPAWDMLLRDGRLRRDIHAVGSVAQADFGLYHHEMHMEGQEYQNWVAFGNASPAHIGGLDGVPVILVFRR